MSEDEQLVLRDDTLACPYDMNAVKPTELRAWCEKLLECPAAKLTVDLSGTKHIASHHLGILSEAWRRAIEAGKELDVVIAPALRRVFELSGFDQVFKLTERS